MQTTEIGTVIIGLHQTLDETGQHRLGSLSDAPITETGLIIFGSTSGTFGEVCYLRPVNWEVCLFPEDKDKDTFIILNPHV